mmetsp:Transcript_693/g.1658  ORF Transcript_693/g.1658 Transcript_693/m.1658 type:complete len:171 (+) Transcript_693:387-899(+)|eukprot:CAMPEP_0172380234 /NCGR_PEP_ID=MMETSP1060-20121228/70326_1 /TAXON_ID=37318 /ORGANISM="Pseudo-nitzschia pungens, Strain cf. cingulata" /LENGTH=170 /DNA_ID=CAMNT_0013107985 /DNA_START=786 /DNA_END=1298 /DNA_ORIENTATION=-
MDKVMEKVEPVVNKIDGFIAKYPAVTQYERFKDLEEITGYPKALFFLASCSLVTILVLVTGGMKLASNLIGFLYPAYMSFKSLDGGKGADGDATQWMMYWIIFCSANLVDETFSFVSTSIPMYYFLKVAVVVWLYHPRTTGAQVIYSSAMRPYILPMMEGSPVKTTSKMD